MTQVSAVRSSMAQCEHRRALANRVRSRFFLLGCGKSGTTWLRNMLHGHPEIVIYGEGAFAWRLFPVMMQMAKVFNQGQGPHQPTMTHLSDQAILDAAYHIMETQLGGYIEYAIEHDGKSIDRLKFVGDKTPQHTVGMDKLHLFYPDAKFIHIMRDPRDVAVSAWFHDGVNDPKGRNFETYIRYYMTEVWPLQVGTAIRFGRSSLPENLYVEVRYEDMLGHEHAVVKTLCEFLGVASTSDEIVGRCVEAGNFRKMSGGRARGEEDAKSFYRKGVMGDWINHLPVELAQTCCDRIAPIMQACQYNPDCRIGPMQAANVCAG